MKPKRLLICLAVLLSCYGHTALVYPKAPDGAREIVAKEIRGDYSFLNLKTNDDVAITIGRPYRWYSVGLTNLASGQFLSGATSRTWRYTLTHGNNFLGVATVIDADSKTPQRFGALYESGFGRETMKALQEAEKLPQVKKQDYELRFLDVPALSFVSIWLHGKSDDIILPLPPTYKRMNADQPYSESQIVKILEPEARRNKAMWAKIDKQRRHDENAYAKAMTDYEMAHGGKCGAISYYGTSAPSETVAPHVETFILLGMSSKCGKLEYKVKVTYEHNFDEVKKVEILEKLTHKSP